MSGIKGNNCIESCKILVTVRIVEIVTCLFIVAGVIKHWN
jgi:hypothetical protein